MTAFGRCSETECLPSQRGTKGSRWLVHRLPHASGMELEGCTPTPQDHEVGQRCAGGRDTIYRRSRATKRKRGRCCGLSSFAQYHLHRLRIGGRLLLCQFGNEIKQSSCWQALL